MQVGGGAKIACNVFIVEQRHQVLVPLANGALTIQPAIHVINCIWTTRLLIPYILFLLHATKPSMVILQYCPVCERVYRFTDKSPMVECEGCARWVHIQCDGIDDETYKQMAQGHYFVSIFIMLPI